MVSQIAFRAGFQLYLFAEGSPQQMVGFQHDLVQIDHARLQRLLSREGQQAAHEIGAAIGGAQRDVGRLAGACICAGPFGQHVQIADNDGQKVVEVVGDATGELPNAFHLLGLRQMTLRHPAIGHILANGDNAGRARRAIVPESLGPDDACAAIRTRDAKFLGVRSTVCGTARDRLFEWLAIRLGQGGKELLKWDLLDRLRPAKDGGDLRRRPNRPGRDVEGDGAHVGDRLGQQQLSLPACQAQCRGVACPQ